MSNYPNEIDGLCILCWKTRSDSLQIECESRVTWIKQMCDILGYNNDDGFHSDPNPFTIAKSLKQNTERLQNQQKILVDAIKGAIWLYDEMAMSPFEAAAKHGPDYTPPSDEDCLEVRKALQDALSSVQENP